MTDTQTNSDVAGRAAPVVGVVRESGTDERRVALVPKAAAALVNSGVAVVVESGAGEQALLPDELYTEAGAAVGGAWRRTNTSYNHTQKQIKQKNTTTTLNHCPAHHNTNNQINSAEKADLQAFAAEAIPGSPPPSWKGGSDRAISRDQRMHDTTIKTTQTIPDPRHSDGTRGTSRLHRRRRFGAPPAGAARAEPLGAAELRGPACPAKAPDRVRIVGAAGALDLAVGAAAEDRLCAANDRGKGGAGEETG